VCFTEKAEHAQVFFSGRYVRAEGRRTRIGTRLLDSWKKFRAEREPRLPLNTADIDAGYDAFATNLLGNVEGLRNFNHYRECLNKWH